MIRRVGLLVALGLAACADDAPEGPRVLAVVDGEALTAAGLPAGTRMEVFRRRADIHALEERAVRAWIEERLLAREAARRGLTVAELLAAEVEAAAAPVSDAEIDAQLAKEGAPPEARPRAALYLEERARIERRLAFVERLREAAKIDVRLEPPRPPRLDVSVDGAELRGPKDAPITVVAFLGWRDPLSSRAAKNLARLREKFPGSIRVAHRAVLIGRDELALEAAILAEMVRGRSAYWRVHDALLIEHPTWTRSTLYDLAREVGVEPTRLGEAAYDAAWLRRIREASQATRDAGVRAPPVLFVNGRYVGGTFGYDALEAVAQEELRSASSPR